MLSITATPRARRSVARRWADCWCRRGLVSWVGHPVRGSTRSRCGRPGFPVIRPGVRSRYAPCAPIGGADRRGAFLAACVACFTLSTDQGATSPMVRIADRNTRRARHSLAVPQRACGSCRIRTW